MLEAFNAFAIVVIVLAPGYWALQVAGRVSPQRDAKGEFQNTIESVVMGVMFPIVYGFALVAFGRAGILIEMTSSPISTAVNCISSRPMLSLFLIVVYFFLLPAVLGYFLGKFHSWDGKVIFCCKERRILSTTIFADTWTEAFFLSGPSVLLVTLKSGKEICGWYGTRSMASVRVENGDLFLEIEYLRKKGRIVGQFANTFGVWISKSEIESIRFYVP